MSEQIEDLLHRRTDLSTFVVHFTRDSETGKTSKDNLLSILKAGKLKTGSSNLTGMGFLDGYLACSPAGCGA